MKCYRKIYAVIESHPEIHVDDRSYRNPNNEKYALNVIVKSPKHGLRIQLKAGWGNYSISTTDIAPNCSEKHGDSFQRIDCRNQKDMAEKLERLLSSGKDNSDAT